MNREREIYKVTLVGGAVNALLVAFKFVSGIIAHSSAMIADAVHSLSDFATDIVVLLLVHISGRPEDKDHDYGHGKYETIATTVIGIALLGVALGILYGGVKKIISWLHGALLPAPGYLALWAAIVSIVMKELIYRYTAYKAEVLDSQAVMANAWHHRSDALSSIGTALGIGGAIILGNRWTVLDPAASIIVSFFILKVSLDLLKNGVSELTESSLPEEVEEEILSIVNSFTGVCEPHHLRTRRIGSYYAIEMHLRMDGNITLAEADSRADDVEEALKGRFGERTHVILHIEPVKESDRPV